MSIFHFNLWWFNLCCLLVANLPSQIQINEVPRARPIAYVWTPIVRAQHLFFGLVISLWIVNNSSLQWIWVPRPQTLQELKELTFILLILVSTNVYLNLLFSRKCDKGYKISIINTNLSVSTIHMGAFNCYVFYWYNPGSQKHNIHSSCKSLAH